MFYSNTRAAGRTLSIAVVLCLAGVAPAQTTAPADTAALVRRAVEHWAEAQRHHEPLEYIVHRVDERRDSTKVIVETADGDVARLIAINGKPLSAEANAADLSRLDTLAAHPEMQARRRRNEERDRDRITHLLSQLPYAFVYKYEGTVSCAAGECADLSFTANPQWTPPDLEAGILRGLAGRLWIDLSGQRLVRLDCRFIADADVGFGLIGRIDEGGTALLEQSPIGDNDWELTRLTIHVSGKALIFKSFAYRVEEHTSRFTPVAPGLHYRDAIDLLKQLDPSGMNAEATH